MQIKHILTLFLVVFLSTSLVAKKGALESPELKAQKYELKSSSGRGLFVEKKKDLEIVLSGITGNGNISKGNFIVFNGEKPYEGKFKQIKFTLKDGQTKTYTYPKKYQINSVDISISIGKVEAKFVQPRFIIPDKPVKKTTEDMASQLNASIFCGAKESTKKMIAIGFDINTPDMAGNTPLFMACYAGDMELVELLIKKGAKPDIKNKADSTALIAAAGNKKIFYDAVPLLVELGADLRTKAVDGTTVLWQLVILPRHGADEIEVLETMDYVLKKGAKVDPEKKGGRTPLMFAAKSGNLPIAKLLVKYGADINAESEEGETAIGLAKEEDHTDIVNYLKSM
ncbi:MAG: ankyrin repeat domain-containing protein [Candidatus Margulisiibacteriota bacterium]|nr:ankyrin repeat domain-containing protein [Candidatus Margulisiibacteriota bacterium]